MESLNVRGARRLALARAGLLRPTWTGLATASAGSRSRAREAALGVLRRFGYLQLDTVSVAGARTHSIVLLSRLPAARAELGESLLRPGEPLFEYWGHEASWLPIELYPAFEFRRRHLEVHPWWPSLLADHPGLTDAIVERIEREGPLRSTDFEGPRVGKDWTVKLSKVAVSTLWLSGVLAVRERTNFQRTFDLAERVIPEEWRRRPLPLPEALRVLLLRALAGHGWATRGTLAATWRLKKMGPEIDRALAELCEAGEIVPCALEDHQGRVEGWARPRDLELVERLEAARLAPDRGVLLSPFDPILWDRARVERLLGFHQVLEIYKPKKERLYGYYCMPVLAGDRLVARVDLKAHRKEGRLETLAIHREELPRRSRSAAEAAIASALARYARGVGLEIG